MRKTVSLAFSLMSILIPLDEKINEQSDRSEAPRADLSLGDPNAAASRKEMVTEALGWPWKPPTGKRQQLTQGIEAKARG